MWYHCTFRESADSILREGYDFRPVEWYDLAEDAEFLLRMLPGHEQEEIKALVESSRSPWDRKWIMRLTDLWVSRFGAGIVIWVADKPLRRYGTHCLSVDIPEDAVDLTPDSPSMKAFYYPRPIPPDRFRLEVKFRERNHEPRKENRRRVR